MEVVRVGQEVTVTEAEVEVVVEVEVEPLLKILYSITHLSSFRTFWWETLHLKSDTFVWGKNLSLSMQK